MTFNANIACSDPANTAAGVACQLQEALGGLNAAHGTAYRFALGIASGPALVGTVGYSRFRKMACLSAAMHRAAQLAQLSTGLPWAVVVDGPTHELVQYAFELRPVDSVFDAETGRGARLFELCRRAALDEDEWMYQIKEQQEETAWARCFDAVMAAPQVAPARAALKVYLEDHPGDLFARRLQARLGFWVPGKGAPLNTGPEIHTPDPFPRCITHDHTCG